MLEGKLYDDKDSVSYSSSAAPKLEVLNKYMLNE